ncbi:MAG: 3'(2'),5'-bisphosphate nucleotidase CysQ [Candidatus Omnitrophica bacterium]|nr:3'(2'),5'-bisphosphate nucleotidase CysQ [Candidatus Omnitrophota bacterium]
MNELLKVIKTAVKAGAATMEIYTTDFAVEYKDDQSPLTLADKKSHEIIVAGLQSLDLAAPILSEEGRSITYDERRQWDCFWCVDPLDGTKEFVNKRDEFTVNIAFIDGQKPILGVIYVPAKKILYFAGKGIGVYKCDHLDQLNEMESLDQLFSVSQTLPNCENNRPYTVVASKSHMNQATEEFIDELKKKTEDLELISAGSSLKFCLVAEGKADCYPRFGPTCEWDTAAGQAICQEAGFDVVDHTNGGTLKYNKEDLLNPSFLVMR